MMEAVKGGEANVLTRSHARAETELDKMESDVVVKKLDSWSSTEWCTLGEGKDASSVELRNVAEESSVDSSEVECDEVEAVATALGIR